MKKDGESEEEKRSFFFFFFFARLTHFFLFEKSSFFFFFRAPFPPPSRPFPLLSLLPAPPSQSPLPLGKETQAKKMSSWSEAEDASLVAAVKRAAAELLSLPLSSFAEQLPPSLPEDINWTTVSTYSGLSATRPGKACRLRYFNHLRPGLLTTPFTVEEDLAVVRRQASVGNSWSSISAHLPGRTDNAVKNR